MSTTAEIQVMWSACRLCLEQEQPNILYLDKRQISLIVVLLQAHFC